MTTESIHINKPKVFYNWLRFGIIQLTGPQGTRRGNLTYDNDDQGKDDKGNDGTKCEKRGKWDIMQREGYRKDRNRKKVWNMAEREERERWEKGEER